MQTNAYDAYRAVRHFGSLDGLRFISIAMVLWHHGPFYTAMADPAMILNRGFTGVDFFFVLSGYLITTLLLREEAREGRFSLLGFYRRRVLRIVPVYFLVITLTAVWYIGVRGDDRYWAYLPYYYLFLANFLTDNIPTLGVMWSLAVEEQYYLLWPATLLILPALTRVRVGVLVVAIGSAVVISQGLLPRVIVAPANDIAHFGLPMPSYAAILIGSLLAVTLHSPRGFRAVWAVAGHRVAPVVIFALLIVAWQVLPARLIGWPNLIMHGLMALFLASIVMREDHVAAPLLRWRPIVRIGVISYGIYLWHLVGRHIAVQAVVASGMDLGPAAFASATMVLYLGGSYLLAEASFRWFESHFLRLKAGKRGANAAARAGE